jgi:hypothetical protein
MFKSATLFFRGPIWMVAAVASAASTAIGIYLSLRGHELWIWLFIAALAVAVASFVSFHHNRVKSETGATELRGKIDAMVRRGFDLYKELDTGPEPTETDEEGRGISFPIWPPDSKWERVYKFAHDANELLNEYDPGLLFAYADGVNAARRKLRRRERQRDKAQENRPAAEQLKQMVERLHRRPAEDLECYVNALVDVRKELDGRAG